MDFVGTSASFLNGIGSGSSVSPPMHSPPGGGRGGGGGGSWGGGGGSKSNDWGKGNDSDGASVQCGTHLPVPDP